MNVAVRVGDARPAGYVGLPLPGVQIVLADDDGARLDVSDDETIGGILVRGPNVFSGYVNRPDATADVLRDGWFQTGDIATQRRDGYVRIRLPRDRPDQGWRLQDRGRGDRVGAA